MSEPTTDFGTRPGDDVLAELADEFLHRYRAGENPSVAEFASRHPQLADRIRDLLSAVVVMEQPVGGATHDLRKSTERVGDTIDRYKLLECIGEGGFGVVYMAEQLQPVRRKVALKIIKPGMDTRQVIARFEAERQALSLMEHPNIAKVYDAGTTQGGRPYFVMELVKGQPITQYCDEKHLTPRERLALFLPVCQAIQHAHQKGIIHRDVKPTNVLVAEYDERPVPKVIDFGVAKAISQPLTDRTMFTGFGQIVGTLEYMSPEQAKVNQLDIDTRSDIYSLGVLMYELLTGSTPIEKQRLRSAAWDEMLRIIREEEPPKPSARLSSLSDSHHPAGSGREGVSAGATQNANLAITIADRRGTDPRRLQQTVRGELDWIVMKALEKDRARRYETASNFAMDIQRYLADEPVQACPPSASYRLRKFTRKNRVPLAVAAGLLLLLMTTAVVGAYHLIRIGAERALARSETSEDALDALNLLVHVHPNEPAMWAARGLAHQEFNHKEKALADHTQAIKLNPKDPMYLIHRGMAYAAFGEWQKAAADFDSSLELNPSRLDAWCMSACTHLARGDMQGYRRCCVELLAWYGQTNDLEQAAQIALMCTLAPNAVPDFSQVEKLAEFCVKGTEMHPARHYFIQVKALTELRAGRHEQAAKWLRRRELYADGNHYDAAGFAALAMAQHGLSQTNEALKSQAVRSLDRAKAILARDMPDPAKGKPFRYFDWHHWLTAQILCREAEPLLGDKEPTSLP